MADEHHAGQCFQCDRAGFLTRYCGNFHAITAALLGSGPLGVCAWLEDRRAIPFSNPSEDPHL